jgi:putative hydrolase of the HAD superfamily
MSTRAVLFDLGNTLVDYYRGAEFHSILRECLRQAEKLVVGSEDHEQLFLRALVLNREAEDLAVRPLADRIRQLFPECLHNTQDEIDRICRAFMGPIFACAKVNDAAAEVLDSLRYHGIKTAIVSNTPWGSPAMLWREELTRHSLLHRVDVTVFCTDVGWRKPHSAPFRSALDQLRIPAQEAIFVGDDPRWDVEGAKRAGLRPLLLSIDYQQRTDCAVIHSLREVVRAATGDAEVG